MRAALASAVLALLLWQAVVTVFDLPHFILPCPAKVGAALWDNGALLASHAGTTLIEVLIGLVLGGSLGALTALSLAHSRRARDLLKPLLAFTQALPVFALAPILTLWLGYGLWSKVAMAVLIIFFPVMSAFLDGLLRTPAGWLDLAQTMGARERAVLVRLRVPHALPALGAGLKLAAVYAPIGAVIGEWVGSSSGLGYLMLLASGRAKVDLMFAAMLVLGVMSVTLYAVVGRVVNRAVSRFSEGTR
ncbi:MAG: ABC transporter permease [Pseudomonadota bacterium]